MAITTGSDRLFVESLGTLTVGLGEGDDLYVIDGAGTGANSKITINDSGINRVQLTGGLTIKSSLVASNTTVLTLSNGAEITISNAAAYSYIVGGVIGTGTGGTTQTYTQFATTTLGATAVPAVGATAVAGTVNKAIVDPATPVTPVVVVPTFSIAAGAASVIEAGNATFTVTLSAAQAAATTVNYTLAGTGTPAATLGTDTGTVAVTGTGVTSTATTLTFAAGSTTATITVPVTLDATTETGEGLSLTLTAPSTGTSLGANAVAVTALADPAAPTFTMTSSAVAGVATLEGGTITLTVTPSSVVTAATVFNLTVIGQALGGYTQTTTAADFGAIPSVSFAAGATAAQTVSISVASDSTAEGIEAYKISLLNSLGVDVATALTGIINDSPNASTTGQPFTLTAGVDNGSAFIGTSGNDTFTANTAAGALTLSSLDNIDGAAGTGDTLVASVTAAIDTTTISGYVVKNIEIATLSSTSTAVVDTTPTWTGLTSLTVAGVGATAVTAANTTDTVVTASSAAAATVSVLGGKAVTLTASGVTAAGQITVGSTTAAPVDTVSVTTSTLSTQTTNTSDAITVTGGTTVNISAGLVGAVNNTITGGQITVNGNASTTGVTVSESARVAATTTVSGSTPGPITITDANATTATDTIKTVSLTNFGATTVASNVLDTVTLKGGTSSTLASGTLALNITAADTSVRATTLNLNLNGGFDGAITGTQADRYTTVNLVSTAASTVADVSFAAATLIAASGTTITTLTANTNIPLAATITSTGAGLSLGTALANNVTFTGGTGNETVAFGATTKANNLGDGDNTATVNVTALGTGGSIKAGVGTKDTLSMTGTNAATASAAGTTNTAFVAAVTGFERLTLTQTASTVDVAALLGATNGNFVTIPAANAALVLNNISASGTGGATINLNSTAGTTQGGITLGGTTGSGTNDVLNIALKDTLAAPILPVAYGSITAPNVENFAITLNDSRTTGVPSQLANTFTITDPALVSVTVSGNQSLTLTHASGTALTNVDARGMTLGALTFTSNANQYATTVNGSALGNDFLNFSAATGSVTINEPTGAATVTGGTAADTLNFSGTSNAQIYVAQNYTGNGTRGTSGSGSTSIDTINGFRMSSTLADVLHIPDTTLIATVAAGTDVSLNVGLSSGLTLTATAVNATGLITFAGTGLASATIPQLIIAAQNAIGANARSAFFISGGDAYVVDNVDASAAVGPNDIVVKLAGLSTATALSTSAGATNIDLDTSSFYNNADNNASTITGGVGADIINGGTGADIINGGTGADIIVGGGGADTLTGGGTTANIFYFSPGDSGTPSATNFDTITDFNAVASNRIIWGGTSAGSVANTLASTVAVASGTAGLGNANGVAATFNAADNTFALHLAAVELGIRATANTAGESAIWVENATDTYVFISDGVDGVGANDILIKLTGITGADTSFDVLTLSSGNLTLA